jgi:hypothetical protein
MTITTSYNSKALQQPCEDKIIEYHKEFQMSPESIKNDIQALRDWLIQNPHLPNIDGSYNSGFFYNLGQALVERQQHY